MTQIRRGKPCSNIRRCTDCVLDLHGCGAMVWILGLPRCNLHSVFEVDSPANLDRLDAFIPAVTAIKSRLYDLTHILGAYRKDLTRYVR